MKNNTTIIKNDILKKLTGLCLIFKGLSEKLLSIVMVFLFMLKQSDKDVSLGLLFIYGKYRIADLGMNWYIS